MALPSTLNSQKLGSSKSIKYDSKMWRAMCTLTVHRLFHSGTKCAVAFDRKIINGTNDMCKTQIVFQIRITWSILNTVPPRYNTVDGVHTIRAKACYSRHSMAGVALLIHQPLDICVVTWQWHTRNNVAVISDLTITYVCWHITHWINNCKISCSWQQTVAVWHPSTPWPLSQSTTDKRENFS